MKKISLTLRIFIALVLAIAVGIALTGHPDIAVKYIKPFGTIFLNLVKWVVTPLVFFSIMAGVISMRDIRKVGSVGVKTIVYYLCTTALAETLPEALLKSYNRADRIQWQGKYCRRDIGQDLLNII